MANLTNTQGVKSKINLKIPFSFYVFIGFEREGKGVLQNMSNFKLDALLQRIASNGFSC